MSYQFSTNETYEPLTCLSCYMEKPHRIIKVEAQNTNEESCKLAKIKQRHGRWQLPCFHQDSHKTISANCFKLFPLKLNCNLHIVHFIVIYLISVFQNVKEIDLFISRF
jgi:hypothetical protein